MSEEALLRAAGSAERGSEHPIARALTAHAQLREVGTVEPTDFVAAAGQGLQCLVDGRAVLLGNRSWMGENGLFLTAEQEGEVAALERRGHTVVFVALEPTADASHATAAATAATAAAATDAAGHAPASRTTTLRVGGMTCGHCSARVEEALRAVEGVASATVNLEAGLATVVGSAAAAELVAAVEGTGKSAAVAEAEDGPPTLLLAGALAVADSLKPDARPVVKQLQQRGIEVWMISGDNERTAAHIAAEAGLHAARVVAGVKPAGKLAKVQELREAGAKIGFVGDGVNDAPALAAADVGIAVGSGTDVAIETADVVLMKSSLQDVVTALHLSRVAMRRIRSVPSHLREAPSPLAASLIPMCPRYVVRINFVWAFIYNVVGIPLAAGVLYPGLHIQFPPMFAGAAMALSSVSVVCSSLLLRLYQPPKPLPLARGTTVEPADPRAYGRFDSATDSEGTEVLSLRASQCSQPERANDPEAPLQAAPVASMRV